MIITDFITEEFITTSVQSEDKDELFAELVELLSRGMHARNIDIDSETILSAIAEREEKMSTGIGHGIAMPHGKTDAVHDLCGVLGISKRGIDYEALDGEPVHIIFLLIAPSSSPGPHIKALQRIASLLKTPGCFDKLCEARSASEAYQVLRDEEDRFDDDHD
jgi:mannitol/fructose-specific phosphotransferase system IIA component (Ntr-type)